MPTKTVTPYGCSQFSISSRIDFVIVVAMKDEYDAIESQLSGRNNGGYLVASIPRAMAPEASYQVAVALVGEQTNAMAQQATERAIKFCRPRAIILAGIAAGFKDRTLRWATCWFHGGSCRTDTSK